VWGRYGDRGTGRRKLKKKRGNFLVRKDYEFFCGDYLKGGDDSMEVEGFPAKFGKGGGGVGLENSARFSEEKTRTGKREKPLGKNSIVKERNNFKNWK